MPSKERTDRLAKVKIRKTGHFGMNTERLPTKDEMLYNSKAIRGKIKRAIGQQLLDFLHSVSFEEEPEGLAFSIGKDLEGRFRVEVMVSCRNEKFDCIFKVIDMIPNRNEPAESKQNGMGVADLRKFLLERLKQVPVILRQLLRNRKREEEVMPIYRKWA